MAPTWLSTTKHDDVGGLHGELGLPGDRRADAGGLRVPAAGVDDGEPLAVPQRLVGDAVPGHARDVLHDGGAPAEDAVDQRRLADVGPADDGDDGQRPALVSRSCPLPRHRARPRPARRSRSTTACWSSSVLSTTTASAAGRSGLSARLLSYSSRRRRSAARAAISRGVGEPELPGPALGADLGRRGQVDLERRVGQDDGADVASLDDDGLGRARRARAAGRPAAGARPGRRRPRRPPG